MTDRKYWAAAAADRTRLDELLRLAREAHAAMSRAQRAAHDKAQRQSWARGMAPCEHGIADWETCPACRAKHGGGDAK